MNFVSRSLAKIKSLSFQTAYKNCSTLLTVCCKHKYYILYSLIQEGSHIKTVYVLGFDYTNESYLRKLYFHSLQ